MHKYSLDFLEDDWDGAGYDFAVAAVFEKSCINSETIINFILATNEIITDVSIKYILLDSPLEWQFVLPNELKLFMNGEFDWSRLQLFVVDFTSNNGFRGYIEISSPDQLVVGGPSESYYSGFIEKDQAIAAEIAAILMIAVRFFDKGYWYFGAGCNSMDEAKKLKSLKKKHNLTGGCCPEIKADIFSKCNEIRELNQGV
ncbi:hypothetical protein [uncultured Gimesia sp.]|uniref:hypothetical protein n=1 Tax=uncultured Gimesia sp. TaxID=1678688 RepID=UPI0030D720A2|tara:strand:- start:1195 stop:1794 length:600 start_codon:yes stop_codon:yes gene_type:complete